MTIIPLTAEVEFIHELYLRYWVMCNEPLANKNGGVDCGVHTAFRGVLFNAHLK
jgi:hypothetical protein